LACVDSTKESEKKRAMGVAQRSVTMQEPKKKIKRKEKKESQEIQKNKEALKKPMQEPRLFAVDFQGASALNLAKLNAKVTAQSIPMWSPTIVLTLPLNV